MSQRERKERVARLVERALNNFIWRRDGRGDPWTVYNIRRQFEGDCDCFVVSIMAAYYGGYFQMFWALLKGKAKMHNLYLPSELATQGEKRHWVGEIERVFFDNIRGGPYDSIKEYYRNGYQRNYVAGTGKILMSLIRGLLWN